MKIPKESKRTVSNTNAFISPFVEEPFDTRTSKQKLAPSAFIKMFKIISFDFNILVKPKKYLNKKE
jgi:hypothetical protein